MQKMSSAYLCGKEVPMKWQKLCFDYAFIVLLGELWRTW